MKRITGIIILGLLTILQLSGCSPKSDNEIIVSAAASLQEAVNEISNEYSKKKTDVKIIINLGSSGTLQNQIEQGAPVDVFISAGKSQMDSLENKNLLLKDTRIDLLGNELVLVTAKDNDNVTSLDDLKKQEVKQIGIATPTTVPAGKYTQEALTYLEQWDLLQPKFVFAKDVKQVLSYVETGNVSAGFVYLSDSKASNKVKVVVNIHENSHEPILYPAAIIANTKNREAAEDFMEYLQGPEAKQVFIKYGFKTLR